MKELVLRRVSVRDVVFGEKTEVADGILRIHAPELIKYLREDRHLKSVEIKIARPGERKRILPVKDVLEPRAKLGGTNNTFPGFIGSAEPVGTGLTYVLDGVAVVTCGRLVNFQEGLIDMAGPGSEYSLFSRKLNVVLVMDPVENLGKHEHEKAVRLAGIKAAHYLGLAGTVAQNAQEARYEVPTRLELEEKHRDLPKVIYVDMVIAQGLLHDNCNSRGILPRIDASG